MNKKIYFLLATLMAATLTFGQRTPVRTSRQSSVQHSVQLNVRNSAQSSAHSVQNSVQQTPKALQAPKGRSQAESSPTLVNVSEAIAIGSQLASGKSTTETYCVQGYVVDAKPHDIKYGDQTFFLADDAGNSLDQLFMGYRSLNTLSGVEMQVQNGDLVLLTGQLKNYKDTIEIANGTVTFVNNPVNANYATMPNVVYASDALEIAASLNEGDTTDATYFIVGYVSSIAQNQFSESGYETFWITDDYTGYGERTNAAGAFYFYKGRPDQEIAVGDRVVLRTRIYNHKGTIESAGVYLPVRKSNPVHIDCGEVAGSYYYADDTPKNWYVYGGTNDYFIQLDYYSDNASSPDGTYSSNDDQMYILYTGICNPFGERVMIDPSTAAQITVTTTGGRLTVSATMICVTGNIYYITMDRAYALSDDTPAPITLYEEGYDIFNQLVFCAELTDKAKASCGYTAFIGSYNNWSLTDGFVQFESLTSFSGWYVAQMPYVTEYNGLCMGKPIHTDYYGLLDWDYLPLGTAITHKGGKTANITVNDPTGYDYSIEYAEPGAYIYSISEWIDGDPCKEPEKHNYTVRVYPPVCASNSSYTPALVLTENGQFIPMTATTEGYYETTIQSVAKVKYNIYEQSDPSLGNGIMVYNADSKTWYSLGDRSLPKTKQDGILTLTLSDPDKYKWQLCPDAPVTHDVVVDLYPPTGTPDAGIEIIGSFSKWTDGIPMTDKGTYWRVTLKDISGADIFKFREAGAGNWNNQIQYYNTASKKWEDLYDMLFSDYWEDGAAYGLDGYKYIQLDMSDAAEFAWSKPKRPSHDYTVRLYAPTICDETPGIIGDFNEWKEPVAMTPEIDTNLRIVYTATFTMQEGQGFKIVAMPAGAWDGKEGWNNQINVNNGGTWSWPDNYIVGDKTDILLEWDDWNSYRFGQCINVTLPAKKVVIAAFLPEVMPTLGAEIIGSFNNWRQNEEAGIYFTPVPNVKGLYYAIADAATAEDYFKIRQADSWKNQILAYDANYTDGNGEHWRKISDGEWMFGKLWMDAATAAKALPTLAPFAGMADKCIAMTLSDLNRYKWEKTPQTITIDCGSNFTWRFFQEDQDWYINAAGEGYNVYLDFIAQDKSLPTGTFSTKDFLMKYSSLVDPQENKISFSRADATVKVEDGIISIVASIVGDDGNTYNITAAMELPVAKQKETIRAVNLGYEKNTSDDYHQFYAENDDYGVSVIIYPSDEPHTGTFTIGQELLYISVTQGSNSYNAVSGSVTITEDANGKMTLTGKVLCYNSVEYTLDLANFEPALGATTIRVLVPTDNNMNIDNGVFIWWWYDKKEGQCVQANSIGGRWFEAHINVGDDSHFNFLVVNANVGANSSLWSAAGTQKTKNVENVTKSEVCYEAAYNNSASDWTLYEVDCANKDHDYRFTSNFNTSQAGRLVIELTANQIAPYYEIGYRTAGSGDKYTYSYWTNPSDRLNATFEIEQDTEYEYLFYAFAKSSVTGYEYEVSAISSGTFKILANPNIPQNINTVVNDEKVTVTWTPQGTQTAYYKLLIYDGNTLCYSSDRITSTSATASIYLTGDYYWELRAYDEYDNNLSAPYGTLTITKVPDLRPTNLNATVKGKTVTFTWEQPAPANLSLFYIYQDSPYKEEVKAEVSGTDGKFSYTYTFADDDKRELNWSVYSLIEGADYFYAGPIQGAVIQAEVMSYKLTIAAGEGGKVNDGVNGIYEEGTIITITATADEGYEFSKWSDGNTEPTRFVKMTKDITLTATFKKTGGGDDPTPKTSYTLHIASAGGGKVNEEVNKTYNENDAVTITATPDDGWTFSKWSDDNTQATRVLTMNKDYDLIAYFKTTKKFKVTVTAGTGGKVVPDDIKDKEYEGGTSLTIEAKANSGYEFLKWSDGNKEAKRTLVITRDTVLKATFEEKETFTLRVEILPDDKAGSVLFDGDEVSSMRMTVETGTSIRLKAKPSDGYVFVRYEDGDENITTKEYDVTVTKNKTVYAVFKKEEEGIDNVQGDKVQCTKVIENGVLYIKYNGTKYNVMGKVVN